jgi:hypothetical protein
MQTPLSCMRAVSYLCSDTTQRRGKVSIQRPSRVFESTPEAITVCPLD